jgi:hypothetical protein
MLATNLTISPPHLTHNNAQRCAKTGFNGIASRLNFLFLCSINVVDDHLHFSAEIIVP